MALPAKRQRFVEEYLLDLNATQAAIRAGYSSKSTSAKTEGERLLRNADVAAAIKLALNGRSERTGITADNVIERIDRIAQAAEAMGELATALKGLELLGKHLKLFTDRVEHSGHVTLEKLIADSMAEGEE